MPTADAKLGEKALSLQFLTVPPANGQAPSKLMVCLHGWGANMQDLPPIAPMLNLPEYQFLFTDAPFRHPQVPGGKMWYDLKSQNYQGLTESRQLLINWLQSLENSTGVPLSSTILMGFSQGGAMTLDVGLTLPLAGLVSLSGFLHSAPQLADRTRSPILMVHGRQDPIIPLEAARGARDSLTWLGIAVKYQEFNMGHEIRPEVLHLMQSFVVDVNG